jgi:uncharacterized membrane protein YedE/YeeE
MVIVDAYGLSLLGGALIGLAAGIFLLVHGRIAGISGLFGGLFLPGSDARAVRLSFVVGLVGGGFLLGRLYPAAVTASGAPTLPVAVLAGLLVGFGTRLGGGCTSGHGICGLSRFSLRSVVATMTFMGVGVLTVFFARHILGGGGSR